MALSKLQGVDVASLRHVELGGGVGLLACQIPMQLLGCSQWLILESEREKKELRARERESAKAIAVKACFKKRSVMQLLLMGGRTGSSIFTGARTEALSNADSLSSLWAGLPVW